MENQKFGTSQFAEQVNYQRGLEGELARTIQSISAVQTARVHLAIPKPTVFVREEQKPSASVLLNLYAGRTLDAARCVELGLASRVVPAERCLDEARALAAEIAANAPLAVQGTKRMMRMGLDETFETHVHHVYLQLLPLFGSDDFREGMAAFVGKRPAEFKGR